MTAPDLSSLLSVLLACGLIFMIAALWLLSRRSGPSTEAQRPRNLRRDRNVPLRRGGLISLLMRYLEEPDEKSREKLRKTLFQAGFPGPSAPHYFAISKLVCGLIAIPISLVVFNLILQISFAENAMWLIVGSLTFLVGYSLPGIFIQSRADRYVAKIAKGLPDALDLMLVSVEAGQSLDLSLVRVAKSLHRIHPELAERFATTAEALKAGADRASAFERLAYETDNIDLKSFARVVLQSSTMGTPVAETFRVFSADQRSRRITRIEEQANVLPTKLTLGTMLFTVPPFLLLMLAPALYSISKSF
ncbi:type II secretion system F family protein [Aquicoccus porphyridii]|uniref:Type II secretion system F family protein n=1 Tax=Aquicoccus porphyridii TaxID=1852029 RepID=A0A5A9Z528_9RHOB|nr:type II secretion system F family protein [Aquicoccus porphyridii]KAA0912244.1 type II secretion system F family protein [Aquicoccus porphyridii]RAI52907.1 hypothetical protein DOO74_15590 [Rhodobacteraceae bacterium AsT-22]